MNMTITNLPSPILYLILNDESLARVSDFKAIREVCRCFNDHKTVQKLRVQHTGTNIIFSLVHDKKVECLALRGDLAGITVPESLPVSLTELSLGMATNIPPELITLALQFSTIKKVDLSHCDLAVITAPEPFSDSLKELCLLFSKNVSPELIDKAREKGIVLYI